MITTGTLIAGLFGFFSTLGILFMLNNNPATLMQKIGAVILGSIIGVMCAVIFEMQFEYMDGHVVWIFRYVFE